MCNNSSYLAKAQEIYENIVYNRKKWYEFFLQYVFRDYGIIKEEWDSKKFRYALNTLYTSGGFTPYLEFWVTENQELAYKYWDSYEDSYENYKVGHTYLNIAKDERFKIGSVFDKDKNFRDGQYAIIGAIEICKKKFTIPQDCSDFPSSFCEFCVKFCYTYYKEYFYNYKAAQTLLFFSYLWKSVAVGEFYFVRNYEKIIHPVNLDANPVYLEYGPEPFPDFISYISDISSSLVTFFNRVTKNIGAYELYCELDLGINVESALGVYKESDLLKLLMNLTQKLFDITVIDTRYFTSDANLSTLANFIYGADGLLNNLIKEPTLMISAVWGAVDETSKAKFLKVLNSLLFKACCLMSGMLKQRQPDTEKVFFDYDTLSNGYIDLLLKNYKNKYNNYYVKDNDDFIKYKLNYGDKERRKIRDHQRYYKDRDSSLPLVDEYNKSVYEGIDYYLKDGVMHELLKDKDKSEIIIKKIKKYISGQPTVEKAKRISPSIVRKSISWLHEYIKNNNGEESHEAIYLYGKALNYLRFFINVYKNGKDSPLRYRPYFEYSYVEVTSKTAAKKHFDIDKFQNYNLEDFEDFIFFASFQYDPINMEYLNNFYSYHNREHRIYESEAIDKSIGRTDGIIDSVKEERGRTLQLVGLLGSFIAFIAASVRSQKVNETIGEYLTFTCTYVIGVLLFVLCVYLISNTTKSSKVNNLFSWCLFAVLVFFLAVLVYSTLFGQDSSAVHRLFHLLWRI